MYQSKDIAKEKSNLQRFLVLGGGDVKMIGIGLATSVAGKNTYT